MHRDIGQTNRLASDVPGGNAVDRVLTEAQRVVLRVHGSRIDRLNRAGRIERRWKVDRCATRHANADEHSKGIADADGVLLEREAGVDGNRLRK
jgi:hypothetical protein